MSDGFLGRWARRKLEVKQEELARQAQQRSNVDLPESKLLETKLPESNLAATVAEGDGNVVSLADGNTAQKDARPLVLPTEADLEAVSQGGEIRGFMNPQVSGELRNKAFKALFSQPQFNQMDFMDVYVDDYSVSKPLTAAMIDMMALGKQLLSRPDLEPKTEMLLSEESAPIVRPEATDLVSMEEGGVKVEEVPLEDAIQPVQPPSGVSGQEQQ
jgi:hypothetical protein